MAKKKILPPRDQYGCFTRHQPETSPQSPTHLVATVPAVPAQTSSLQFAAVEALDAQHNPDHQWHDLSELRLAFGGLLSNDLYPFRLPPPLLLDSTLHIGHHGCDHTHFELRTNPIPQPQTPKTALGYADTAPEGSNLPPCVSVPVALPPPPATPSRSTQPTPTHPQLVHNPPPFPKIFLARLGAVENKQDSMVATGLGLQQERNKE
ncbi:hypothetical protein FS749_004859 [Ceratobasidium sp. UAMH 11750]|nr:hypothetical protein FS749_004859 [Ceratobasidium sp. UAMH 11750]